MLKLSSLTSAQHGMVMHIKNNGLIRRAEDGSASDGFYSADRTVQPLVRKGWLEPDKDGKSYTLTAAAEAAISGDPTMHRMNIHKLSDPAEVEISWECPVTHQKHKQVVPVNLLTGDPVIKEPCSCGLDWGY